MKSGELVGGRYRVERELGKGGMGAVYEATDTQNDRRVALKIASASGRSRDLFRARFKREARIGHYLGREPGLVRALAWGDLPEDRIYLVMDLIADARPLDLCSGSREERLKSLVLASDLVRVVHEQGVMHRDVKPENFLIDGEGRMHLSDFGLAKPFRGDGVDLPELAGTDAAHTQAGVGIGTPVVMPPEQFKDLATVDARVDVFALGSMLFVALTGRYPYEGNAPQVVQRQMRVALKQEPPPRPRDHDPSVPAALDAACVEALSLEREERPRDGEAFLTMLVAAMQGESPQRRPSPRQTPRRSAPPSDSPRPAARRRPVKRPYVPPTIGAHRDPVERAPRWRKRAGRLALQLIAGSLLVGAAWGGWWYFLRTPPTPGFQPYPGETEAVRTVRLRAIETEDPEDMFELGQRLAAGEGVSADPVAARYWWVEAATKGHVPAMVRVGEMYRSEDETQAVYWLKKAARQGSGAARRLLQELGTSVE